VRKDSHESMEEWADRVRKYELGLALQQLATGQDVYLIMEAMAARIQQKLFHPVIIEIKKINSLG